MGRASLTVSVRPPKLCSCSWEIAFCASWSVAISTNAKPRARPVSRSRMTFTVETLPAFANSAVRSSSLVSYGRLPTYSLLPILHSAHRIDALTETRRSERDAQAWLAQEGALARLAGRLLPDACSIRVSRAVEARALDVLQTIFGTDVP